jgi:hypothetical protein
VFKISSARGFDKAHPCVFVLSTGRVGTMTLARLLSLASNMYVLHEPNPSLYSLSKANYEHDFGNSGFAESIFWTVREQLIKSALNVGCGYVETSPQCTFLASAIFRALPSVKFIHLVRHPTDIVISGMKRNWFGGHPADKTRISPRKGSKYYEIWNGLSQFEKNAWLWTETNQWILDFLKSIPSDQYMTVHSEGLYEYDQNLIEDLFSFFGTDAPNERRVRKVLSKKHNKQTYGDFPPFLAWSPDMINQLKEISGDLPKNLGYEF